VLTNTAFPFPFDHVLVWFVSRHPADWAVGYSVLGAVCAGIAGLFDVAFLGKLRSWAGPRLVWARFSWGRWFYAGVFCCALLPIPFTVVRLAVLRAAPPDRWVYALVVALGRLPRYLGLVWLWRAWSPPMWVAPALVVSAVPFAIRAWQQTRISAPPPSPSS